MHTEGMRSKSGLDLTEGPDATASPTDARTLAAIERSIELDESAVRRRFRQNVAMAIIFALAALTLVLIVQMDHLW